MSLCKESAANIRRKDSQGWNAEYSINYCYLNIKRMNTVKLLVIFVKNVEYVDIWLSCIFFSVFICLKFKKLENIG